MCNSHSGSASCIAEILSVINILQRNVCPDGGVDTCDKPTLGGGNSCLVCNTRPVMIFTCCGNGEPFSMATGKDFVDCDGPTGHAYEKSYVFRVEKVEDNCATFRVLVPNLDCATANRAPFVATNSFFTFDLKCACAIKCLSDSFVECV